MQVDEPGSDQDPRRRPSLDPVQPGHGTDDAVVDHDLGDALRPPPGSTSQLRAGSDARAPTADDAGVKAAAPARPASRYSSAIRTATPFVTCSVITDRGSAATSGGDLHALVHRARVHDHDVRRRGRAAAPG